MERKLSHTVQHVPQSHEELREIVHTHLKNEDILMCTWDDNDMQDIPGSEKCRKVNLSKLLQNHESQAGSATSTLRSIRKAPGELVTKMEELKMSIGPDPVTTIMDFGNWGIKKIAHVLALDHLIPDELNKKIGELRKKIGPNPKITIEDFENWGKTQRAHVLATHPESLDQLKQLIPAAKDMGLKVRCAGAKHSWAPLFADSEQLLIYMDKMTSDYPNKSKLYMVKNMDTTVDVHVMAGVQNEEFKKFQLDTGVSIPANVILTCVQVVSVIVTGCHGVGNDCICPCDYVVQMRIVDSNGQLKIYTRETHGEEMMKAAIANFGLFGVVYDLTIRLENKQTFVKTINEYFSVEHIFYTAGVLEGLVENNYSVELFWFPMNSHIPFVGYNPQKDDVWVRLINKDDSGKNNLPGDEYYKIQEQWDKYSSENYLRFQFLFKNSHTFPLVQHIAFSTIKGKMYPTRDNLYEELPEAVHFRKYIEYVPVYDMEFAFDLSEHENYDLIRQASQFVINEVKSEYSKSRCPLNVAMEMRWMSHSDAYLCPASIVKNKATKDPKIVYIEILSLEGSEGWEEFCVSIGKKWMELGGVPHLAKQWEFLPDIHKHIREKFGDRIYSFKQQLKRSGADCNAMFMNEGLNKLLYSE